MFLGVRLEIPEILQLLDVFLFPSKSEGLGIVAVEAQASKCQCILSTTIPREVDLSLGLVEYVLVSEKRKWIESIEKKVEEKIIVNNSEIINSRFNLKNTIKQLMEIYG